MAKGRQGDVRLRNIKHASFMQAVLRGDTELCRQCACGQGSERLVLRPVSKMQQEHIISSKGNTEQGGVTGCGRQPLS
jgi:hypothetical protein